MRKGIILGLCFLLTSALLMGDEPSIFGLRLFQDCEEMEMLENFKGIERIGGFPLSKKYVKKGFTVNGIEIGKMVIGVGKKIKDKKQRQTEEDYKFPYKFEEDPFVKSAQGYVVLDIVFDFNIKQWEKMLMIIKKAFGKPAEENIKKNPKVGHIQAEAMWKFEDGSSMKFQVITALGTAFVKYKSNW